MSVRRTMVALAVIAACGKDSDRPGSLQGDLDRHVRPLIARATSRAELDGAIGGCVSVIGMWQAREPARRTPDFDPFADETYARVCTVEVMKKRLALATDCTMDPAVAEHAHRSLIEHGHTALAGELAPDLAALRTRCPP